jgi:hypothetical protein
MSIGSILVGAGVALVLGVYLARPFRASRGAGSLDRTIDSWVAQIRAEKKSPGLRDSTGTADDGASFCPQCGRAVGPDDRFCSGCGTRLEGNAV